MIDSPIFAHNALSGQFPYPTDPLENRLQWVCNYASSVYYHKENLRDDEMMKSTDRIRTVLFPTWTEQGASIADQIHGIHQTHMAGNEHLILDAQQASRVLAAIHGKNIESLGGVFRSREGINLGVSLGGVDIACTAPSSVPSQMDHLSEQMEELFPLGQKNPKVTAETLPYIQSGIQLAIALIHPWAECNARSSEDVMYTGSNRRPDLARAVRFPSHDGNRSSPVVHRRGRIINQAAGELSHSIARLLNFNLNHQNEAQDYNYLLTQIVNHRPHPLARDYFQIFNGYTQRLIDGLSNFAYLRTNSAVTALSYNLQSAPSFYEPQNP